jgi:uncharacterized membrane protein YhhN
MASRLPLLFAAALVAGASYTANHWLGLDGPAAIAWKGSGVGLLALWAALTVRTADGRLIAAALALGALGDMLLNAVGLTVGAVAFLAGHVVASILYLRHRRLPPVLAAWLAGAVALLAYALPDDRAAAPGIALYALGLGAMFGTAVTSRFPRANVGLGAALFVFSDLLIFAQMGPLAGSVLPGLLIWPTYFAGQALIAWGVTGTLARERRP